MISRYFERDTDRDIDSIVNLFADDATVIDEGEERHGTAEIRAWQTGAASKYTYTTEITGTKALGPDRYLVTGRLTGNFPRRHRRPQLGLHHRRPTHHAAHNRPIAVPPNIGDVHDPRSRGIWFRTTRSLTTIRT